MGDDTYGTPIGDTGFVASTPEDRARWLYDTIREFQPEVERVLHPDVVGRRECWHIIKNEPYEQAFLRMVAKVLTADARRDRIVRAAEAVVATSDAWCESEGEEGENAYADALAELASAVAAARETT